MPAKSPQASVTVHEPVEPPPPNRALSRSVKPDSPPAQVNTLLPMKLPPHGVKWAITSSALTTVPVAHPGSEESKLLVSELKSVCAVICTGNPGTPAEAGPAGPSERTN